MIRIRRMTEGDARRAAALEKENFSEPWTETAFLDTLRLDYAYYYVAEMDETTAGMEKPAKQQEGEEQQERENILQRNEEKDASGGKKFITGICGLRVIAGEGEITNVSVDRNYRKRGIGAAMLEHVLEEGKKLGIEAFTLEVRCSNQPAIRLYEKFGFIGEGVRKGFYKAAFGQNGEAREDALIMWKRQERNGGITTVFTAKAHV